MKQKVRFLLLLLMGILTFSTIQAYAADDRLGTVVGGSLLTDDKEATITVGSKSRGAFFSSGTGSIALSGARQICASGATTCYYAVDQISVKLCVQRLSGNNWVTVYTVPTATKYNAYRVSTSKYYSVTGGYYYRLFGSHAAYDDGAYEGTVSYTSGLWVD